MVRVHIFSAIDIIWELSRKELKNQFSRFSWGKWWIFLLPVLVIIGISWAGKVALRVNEADFPLFLALGFVFWFFFANSVQESIHYVLGQKHLFLSLHAVDLVYLPPVKVVANFIILIAEASMVGLFIFVKHGNVFFLVNMVFVGIVFLFFTLGVSYFFVALTIVLRDLLYSLSYLFMFLLWLTPVFYSLQQIPQRYLFLYRINPLAYFFDAVHRGIFLSEWLGSSYAILAMVAAGCFMGGIGVFRIYRTTLVKALLA